MINDLKHNSIIDLLGSIIVKNMLRARCNGELGELTKSINEHRSRPLANPRSDRERLRDGPPEFSTLDALRVLWHARSHRADLDRTMALLADEPSRELLRRILAYRALGPRYVNLPSDTDNPLESQPQATACMVGPGDDPAFGTQLYRMGDITIEAWPLNIWADFFEQQYVFERDGIRIAVEPGDSVLDLGACFGDTSLTFAAAAGETGRVDAFEPMSRQVEVIERNLARNPRLRRGCTFIAWPCLTAASNCCLLTVVRQLIPRTLARSRFRPAASMTGLGKLASSRHSSRWT